MAERRDTKNRLLWKGEYQKADGRYMYRYVDSKGEARFIYSWTLTQTDRPPKGKVSEKCLREMEKDIAKDLTDEIDTFNAKKLTLNAFFEDYMEQKQELKPSTRGDYKYMYERCIRGYLGHRKIPDIKYSDIKKFYIHLIQDLGFKPGTVEGVHTILHPIFTTAVRDGYIRTNPTDGVIADIKRSNNWEKGKRRALTVRQQEVFIEYTKSHKTFSKWMPVLTVLMGTGCRIGEVAGLTWSDCDFKNNIIHINHTLVYRSNENTRKCETYISTPKTKAGKREIPMFAPVREVLKNEMAKQMQSGFSDVTIDGCSGFIFLREDGSIIKPYSIDHAILRIIDCYNAEESELAIKERREPFLLPHFSAHHLRHTFCTRLCENDVNIKVIQDIMGHADSETTMDIYAEVTREKKKDSLAQLECKMKIC